MAEDFRDQLRELGLKAGDVVLVHSSMKALQTERTPEDVIRDILGVIGADGTLLVPALTYAYVNDAQPLFSARATEPCIGLIPRRFFHMDGVVRSLHPTHSVCAYGKDAEALTNRHILDETPVGPNSPFRKLPDCNGKLLFIGNVLACCTFMHGVEEIVGAPYVLKKARTRYVVEDQAGNRHEKELFAHNFKGWRSEYQKIKDILRDPEIRTGKVGQADCFLIDAAALQKRAIEKFSENVYYFVTDISKS